VSAWAVGATAKKRRTAGVAPQGDVDEVADEAPSVDSLVTWIPGEVIAFYAALVLAFQPEQDGGTSPPLEITSKGWLIFAVVLAAVITLLGGWSRTKKLTGPERGELLIRACLAAVAFALWSFVVPGSAWYAIDYVAEHSDVVLLVAGVVAVVFSLFAEGIVLRNVGGARA
jgi:hypothetical protein